MLLGIMSDSHGRHKTVRKAVELFTTLGVERIIHCGDVGGPEVFDELVGRPLDFVWGNMDFPDAAVLEYLRTTGLREPGEPPLQLEFDEKSVAIFHGHEPQFSEALEQLTVNYILHGHTHVARNELLNGRRIINPGALFRASRKTVATLDTRTDAVAFHEIKGA